MKDENGMPVPSEESPLPWKDSLCGIMASNGAWVLEDEFLSLDDFNFALHAANWIIPCREIVRRLAELGSIGDRALLHELAEDAAKLWDEMQAKGAGMSEEMESKESKTREPEK